MLMEMCAIFRKVVEDPFLPQSTRREHGAAIFLVLGTCFLSPVQEHECMGPIHSDPNFFRPKSDAEISRFERFRKIPGFERRVSEVAERSGDSRIKRLLRCPAFSIIRIVAQRGTRGRGRGEKEEGLALLKGEAGRHNSLGMKNGRWGAGGNRGRPRAAKTPSPGGPIRRARNNAVPVGRNRHYED